MHIPRLGAFGTTPMGAVTAGLEIRRGPVEADDPSPYGWGEEGSDSIKVRDGPGL